MPSLRWVLYEYQHVYHIVSYGFCHFALLIFPIFFLPTGKLDAIKICIHPWKWKTNTKIPLQLIWLFFFLSKIKWKRGNSTFFKVSIFFNVRIVYTSRPIYLLLQICYFINLCVFVLAAKKMLSYMHYCCICVLPLNFVHTYFSFPFF